MRLSLVLGFVVLSSCTHGIQNSGTGENSVHPTAEWALTHDSAAAEKLLKEGEARVASGNLEDFQAALENNFLPAMRACSNCLRARAWLAISYIRLIEQTPRDEVTFAAITTLVEPVISEEIPEASVVARAEWLRLLGRNDEALELLDGALASRATGALQAQRLLTLQAKNPSAEVELSSQPPGDPRILLNAYLASRTPAAAGQLVALFPAYVPGRLALASAAIDEHQPERALELVRGSGRMTVSEKQSALALEVRALAVQGHAQEALGLLEGATAPSLLELRLCVLASLPATHEAYQIVLGARALQHSGKLVEARAELLRASFLRPGDAELTALLGDAFFAEHHYADAENRFLKALAESNGKNFRAALGVARVRVQLREPDPTQFMQAHGARREWLLGVERVKQGAPKHFAQEHFAEARRLGIHEAQAFTDFGRAAEADQYFELAEFYYAQALRYDAVATDALAGIANARFELTSPSAAIAYLTDKLEQNPRSNDIELALAIIYLRAGYQQLGKQHLLATVRRNSNYGRAFQALGNLTTIEGNQQADYQAKRHSYRYALAAYEMAEKLWPEDPEAIAATADLYFDIRDLGAASRNYYRLISLSPRYPNARLRLAQIARNGGDQHHARSLLLSEISVNPFSDTAYVELGNMAMAVKNFSEGAKEFQKATELNPQNSDALFGLGVVRHLEENFAEALTLFSETLRIDPLKADAYWQQGLIYQKLKENQNAVKAYQTYKDLVKEPIATKTADRKIAELGGSMVAERENQHIDSTLAESLLATTIHLLKEGEIAKEAGGRWIASERAPRKFANGYSEMLIPGGWSCQSKESQSICQPSDFSRRGDAFLIVNAKIKRSGVDEPSILLADLAQSRSYQDLSGKLVVSESRYAREVEIAGHTWVESLQLGWQAPDFYSRIYSTVESDLAVMISFSVRKDHYAEYADALSQFEKSLHAYRGNEPFKPTHDFWDDGPLKVTVSRSFDELTPAQQSNLQKIYLQAEQSLVKGDFPALKSFSTLILGSVERYRDTEFFESLAERELDARAQAAPLIGNAPEVQALEIRGNQLSKSIDKVVFREALRNSSVEVLKLDPGNFTALGWKEKINQPARAPASLRK